MSAVVAALIPVFLLMAAGVLARRFLVTEEGHWVGIERLAYFVLFPALLIDTLRWLICRRFGIKCLRSGPPDGRKYRPDGRDPHGRNRARHGDDADRDRLCVVAVGQRSVPLSSFDRLQAPGSARSSRPAASACVSSAAP
jgi:hypothetical protein